VIWAGLVVRVGGARNAYILIIKNFWLENLKRRNHLEDTDVNGRTVKRILQKYCVKV
jgi:hypothetical protein